LGERSAQEKKGMFVYPWKFKGWGGPHHRKGFSKLGRAFREKKKRAKTGKGKGQKAPPEKGQPFGEKRSQNGVVFSAQLGAEGGGKKKKKKKKTWNGGGERVFRKKEKRGTEPRGITQWGFGGNWSLNLGPNVQTGLGG